MSVSSRRTTSLFLGRGLKVTQLLPREVLRRPPHCFRQADELLLGVVPAYGCQLPLSDGLVDHLGLDVEVPREYDRRDDVRVDLDLQSTRVFHVVHADR